MEQIERLEALRAELLPVNEDPQVRKTLFAPGFRRYMLEEFEYHNDAMARAYAVDSLLRGMPKKVYENDRIAGSTYGMMAGQVPLDSQANAMCDTFINRSFRQNSDHFAANFERLIADGIGGTIDRIHASMQIHTDPDERSYLQAMEITMEAFSAFVTGFGDAAAAMGKQDVADTCYAVAHGAPKTFRQAWQLVWLTYVSFRALGKGAMALGRVDQYLYPFYVRDIDAGILTRREATELVACALLKINDTDTVNICIGGVTRDGEDAVNTLSYIFLDAVCACKVPGPNLSARISSQNSDAFLDACLQVIGTGIGYPALMNDEVNRAALMRCGYKEEDVRNYCMVGCIENFIPGMQPPWSDGRFNTPKFLELALNNGVCMMTGEQIGPATGDADTLKTMDDFMAAFEAQLRYGAAQYMMYFRNENERLNPKTSCLPYLSCFCDDCIGRAKDINHGGAIYPSVHGACLMGVGTVADSLRAIEELVYRDGKLTLSKLRDILRANFEGYEEERQMMLNATKYGNDCPEVDRYAKWFVDKQYEIFSRYRTYDGGRIYIAIASNIQNVSAGARVAATPDGRMSGQPLSDTSSPTHGMDRNGPTALVNSVTTPDYSQVACGSVLNQKYAPTIFRDPEKRARLAALIRTYFRKGGQEMQINSVSRDILIDAMNHPEQYQHLVVRVSGFSAYFVSLSKTVKRDILARTEHE